MSEIPDWKCWIGWHHWGEWQFLEHIAMPTRHSTHGSVRVTHHGLNADYYERVCSKCGQTEDKLDRSSVMTRMIDAGEVTKSL